jgi:hypothetical protein
MLSDLLKVDAGITDEAALVYKHILIVGSLTVGEVCEYTGFQLEGVSKAIDELIDARLIRKLAHVVDRYVAVAPYKAFAEHLVELQRTMKEIEENARKSVESTLAEISKTNELFKASSVKMKEEEVSRVKQEIHQLKEEADNAQRDLIEKLRRETEAKRSSLTEMLKKHVDEHSTRITGLRKDITLRLDNSVSKLGELTTKLKEQATQSTSNYLSRLEERIQAFLNSVSDKLAAFQSEFYASAESYQRETSSFLEDSNTKMGRLAQVIKKNANDLMRSAQQTYDQLSTDLERTVSGNIDSGITSSASGNVQLESSINNVIQTYGEKLDQAFIAFGTETQGALDGWRSTNKDELQNWFVALKEASESHLQNLSQKLESTKTPMSEVLRNYLTSTDNASDELNSSINTLVESIKKDLTSRIDTTNEELQESCESAAKDCTSLVAALQSLSKRNIPLTSKALTDFNSDVNPRLSKMFAADIQNAKAFAEEAKQSILKTLATLAPLFPPPAPPAERAKKTTVTLDHMRKEVSEKIDDIASEYVEATKKSIDTVEKYAFTRMSSIMKFEEELEKKWDSFTDLTVKVTDLTEVIGSFPQRLRKVIDELTDQYGKKVEVTVSSTRRLLNVHSKSLADGITSNLKKWSTTIEKAKKELGDIFAQRQDDLDELITKHTSAMAVIASDRTKELTDIISKKVEALRLESLNAQTMTAEQVASNTENIRGSLKSVESKLNEALKAGVESFSAAVESKCKENDDLSTNMISETLIAVTSLKEQLSSMINTEKDEVKQMCETARSDLGKTTSEHAKELRDLVLSLTNLFNGIVDTANERYKQESESTKAALTTLLSQHLKNYLEAVNKVTGELNLTFTKHFDDCSELTKNFGRKFGELLTIHQNKYETASNRMIEGLTTCIDQDEAAINDASNKMLKEFMDNTTKTAKEAGSVENLMRAAWAEITDTQQINADKTWHYVTKRAILNHMKDMVKRTKSTVTVVVPNIEEAPIEEIKKISRAIRIQIITGVDETIHKKLLKELFLQGNVRIWSLTEKDYISCTRDAEEVLIAPVARKDTDCVATVSVEDNYVKLYHKFIGPMWMASSREIREKTLG